MGDCLSWNLALTSTGGVSVQANCLWFEHAAPSTGHMEHERSAGHWECRDFAFLQIRNLQTLEWHHIESAGLRRDSLSPASLECSLQRLLTHAGALKHATFELERKLPRV